MFESRFAVRLRSDADAGTRRVWIGTCLMAQLRFCRRDNE
jgi:hypothetical protein